MDQLVLRELQVHKVQLDQLVHKVLKDIKVLQAQEIQVLKGHKVIKDRVVQVVEQEHRVQQVHKVQLDLAVEQVLKELQVHKVQQEILVLKEDYQLTQFLVVVLSYGLVQQTLFHLVGCYVMVQIAHLI